MGRDYSHWPVLAAFKIRNVDRDSMNRKQTIDAMAQAFNDADEAGLPLEECWGAALDAVLPATTQWPTTEGGQPIFGEGSKYCPRSYMAGVATQEGGNCASQEKIDDLISAIDTTLYYFAAEFPALAGEHNRQVWCKPVSSHSGGVSPNDLADIREILENYPQACRSLEAAGAIKGGYGD